ncbi:hypothetical protein AVEN_227695-1 [Araneus ventricosus]|uniref:Uncharacterized protein n=1 Tax=Araneus ventricosus TaxID=182803 RepID=A0A4Y2TGZ2_ARAVE|nr:hypothetical protein AVEN_227695-1 [Araneus ventricosus]
MLQTLVGDRLNGLFPITVSVCSIMMRKRIPDQPLRGIFFRCDGLHDEVPSVCSLRVLPLFLSVSPFLSLEGRGSSMRSCCHSASASHGHQITPRVGRACDPLDGWYISSPRDQSAGIPVTWSAQGSRKVANFWGLG